MASYDDAHAMKFALGIVKNAFKTHYNYEQRKAQDPMRDVAVYVKSLGKWTVHLYATDAPKGILQVAELLCRADAVFCEGCGNTLGFNDVMREFGYPFVYRTQAAADPDGGDVSGVNEKYRVDRDLVLTNGSVNDKKDAGIKQALSMSENYPKALMGLMASMEHDILKNLSYGIAGALKSDPELKRPEYEYDIDVLNQALQDYDPAFLRPEEKPVVDYD